MLRTEVAVSWMTSPQTEVKYIPFLLLRPLLAASGEEEGRKKKRKKPGLSYSEAEMLTEASGSQEGLGLIRCILANLQWR